MCPRRVRNRNQELTQQCGSQSVSISRDEIVVLRWTDLTCNFLQKKWRAGCKHRQLVNVEALKRVARYLIGHGRLVQEFEFVRQVEEPSHVVVFTDSEHAGCLRTRKGTTSSKLLNGSHMLRSTSTTQGVIAVSSEESEFYAMVKGTSAGLGAVSTLKDLGVDISNNTKIDKAVLRGRVDASAGRGMAVRRGAGGPTQSHTIQAKSSQPTQPTLNPIRERSARPDNMPDGRSTYRSQEINVNSFCEELSSSERTGRPVETDVIQTRSSEDRKSLNVEQTHERTRRLVATLNTADAKDSSRVRSSHESDTFNVEDEVFRERMGKIHC